MRIKTLRKSGELRSDDRSIEIVGEELPPFFLKAPIIDQVEPGPYGIPEGDGCDVIVADGSRAERAADRVMIIDDESEKPEIQRTLDIPEPLDIGMDQGVGGDIGEGEGFSGPVFDQGG